MNDPWAINGDWDDIDFDDLSLLDQYLPPELEVDVSTPASYFDILTVPTSPSDCAESYEAAGASPSSNINISNSPSEVVAAHH